VKMMFFSLNCRPELWRDSISRPIAPVSKINKSLHICLCELG
jgi:hypothetical protein